MQTTTVAVCIVFFGEPDLAIRFVDEDDFFFSVHSYHRCRSDSEAQGTRRVEAYPCSAIGSIEIPRSDGNTDTILSKTATVRT